MVKPVTLETLPPLSWARRHILDLDEFSPEEIEQVLDTAEAMKEVLSRDIKKVPTLRGKVVATLFYEPSTRTRVSFEEAGKVMSCDVINLAPSSSSTAKGESLLNTALTLQALKIDILVIRHPDAGAPYFLARHLSATSVVNAGDGAHAHPTQALLDLFTMRQRWGYLKDLKVVIVGDILYSRVARSNLWGLTRMGARVTVCGPATLIPRELNQIFPGVKVETDLDRALEGAQVVMPLRLQRERQERGLLPSLREYARLYQVTSERLSRAHPQVVVLHPGPMNEGVEISSEVAHGPQSLVEEQVTNGVAVRMAILYLITTAMNRKGEG